MKLIVTDPEFGTITWEVPHDLAQTIDAAEATIAKAPKRIPSMPGLELEKVAGFAKGVVIERMQSEIKSFFSLLALAHRMAKTANPPSKYAKILEGGLVEIAKDMKKI